MSVTYPLPLPSTKFVSTRVVMVEGVGVTASPFTGQQETQSNDLSLWRAEIEIARMTRADAAAWRAFLAKLRGRHGSFLLGDSAGDAPRGTAKDTPGTPVVDGANDQGALTLALRGAPTGAAGYLLEGDMLQLGSGASARLYMVTNDVTTDGSGEATLDIWPRLRADYADGAAITLSSPKGLFMLARNERPVDIERGTVFAVTLEAIEDLR